MVLNIKTLVRFARPPVTDDEVLGFASAPLPGDEGEYFQPISRSFSYYRSYVVLDDEVFPQQPQVVGTSLYTPTHRPRRR